MSAELKILVFPEDGLFKIGTLSGYMLFLWAIPFFIIIFLGHCIQEQYSDEITYISVGLVSLCHDSSVLGPLSMAQSISLS